jgi:cytochrome c peroxidase
MMPSTKQPTDFTAIRSAIRSLLHQPDYDDGSAGPVLVRLAWHSAGTFDAKTRTGGSNGAGMRYEAEGGDPANAGLQHARTFLEPIKAQFPWITYADLWTLAAVVAIQEMDGPRIEWKGGRTDFVDESRLPPRGRLPDGAKGADHLRFIFYRMGFNDQEIVALSGAHNLGRCHSDRSGFSGKWVNNPTRFSNTYFKLLRMHEWKKTKLESGIEQYVYVDEDLDEELMMLPTDIALLEDSAFRPWVHRYAEDKELFFRDFSRVFAKLLELGIRRNVHGKIIDEDGNGKQDYVSAPKKSGEPGVPERSQGECQIGDEARPLKEKNREHMARL